MEEAGNPNSMATHIQIHQVSTVNPSQIQLGIWVNPSFLAEPTNRVDICWNVVSDFVLAGAESAVGDRKEMSDESVDPPRPDYRWCHPVSHPISTPQPADGPSNFISSFPVWISSFSTGNI